MRSWQRSPSRRPLPRLPRVPGSCNPTNSSRRASELRSTGCARSAGSSHSVPRDRCVRRLLSTSTSSLSSATSATHRRTAGRRLSHRALLPAVRQPPVARRREPPLVGGPDLGADGHPALACEPFAPRGAPRPLLSRGRRLRSARRRRGRRLRGPARPSRRRGVRRPQLSPGEHRRSSRRPAAAASGRRSAICYERPSTAGASSSSRLRLALRRPGARRAGSSADRPPTLTPV